ncbi:ABC transporter permease [Salinispira pacifica]
MTSRREVVRVENLSRTYRMGSTSVEALRGVSLSIMEGEFVAIMGASGSGKSTLLNLLGCLDRPTGGHYLLDGEDVASCDEDELADIRGSRIGFVFQSFNLLPRTSARDNVALPLAYRRYDRQLPADGSRGLDRLLPERLLEAVGLPERATHRPNELSGGEQQRVALARSLVNGPSLILADEPTGNLDTLRSREIMLMLASLNNAGITVVLVTHEEEIAAYARRLIRFRDGKIVSDQPIDQIEEAGTAQLDLSVVGRRPNDSIEPPPAVVPEASQGGGRYQPRRGFTPVELHDHLQSAAGTLWHNRLRSLLTALGILIGVAAVIAMMSVGKGAQLDVQQRVEGLGSNLLTIMPGSTRSGLSQTGSGNAPTLTLDDADAIAADVGGIAGVAPEVGLRAQVQHGRINWNTSISGTTADYPVVRNWQPSAGSFFTDADVHAHRPVCVIGRSIADSLFPGEDPVGSTLRIRNASYRVIGVMSARGGSGFGNQDDIVLIPITTAMIRYTGQKQVRTISVSVSDKSLMTPVQERITDLLRLRHRVLPSASDDFTIVSQEEILKTVEGVSQTLTLLLASIAGISLLVGGIGIMNIMLVSVTERTREIGLRKAVGARDRDILFQFLTEAVILSGLGGLFGWILGFGASRLISVIGHTTTVVTPGMILLALGFSVAVGLFFGIFPARKASTLDPIQALRYE